MKTNRFFAGVELEGVIIEYFSPDEFYCSFIEENEYIKLSEICNDDASDVPKKNEVVKHKKFMLRLGDENVLCDVVNDLKFDEVYCQVSLCNTSVQLKVNYQSLRHIHDGINDENIIALKTYDFAPLFSKSWSDEVSSKMKQRLLFNRFIIQFKSNKPDPADGKYPVTLLEIADKKSVTDEYVDGTLAIRYSDYYEAWINHETKRIFDCKEKEQGQYIISSPMFKSIPGRKNKTSTSSKHRFNIEAQPFTPNSFKQKLSTLTPNSLDLSVQYVDVQRFSNGPVFSVSPARSLDQTDPVDKAVLVPSRNGRSLGQSKDTSLRAKRGLEVTSPLSKRKMPHSEVSTPTGHIGPDLTQSMQACTFSPYQPYRPPFQFPFPGTPGQHLFAGRGPESSPPVFSGQASPSEQDPVDVTLMGPYRPGSPKKYPMSLNTFNYSLPFGPTSYSFPPLPYMFQYGPRYNFGPNVVSPDNVTIVQFKANDKSH